MLVVSCFLLCTKDIIWYYHDVTVVITVMNHQYCLIHNIKKILVIRNLSYATKGLRKKNVFPWCFRSFHLTRQHQSINFLTFVVYTWRWKSNIILLWYPFTGLKYFLPFETVLVVAKKEKMNMIRFVPVI